MLSQEDKEQAAEYTMLRLPEVIGNLIERKIEQVEIRKEFFKKHTEFKERRDVVASVIEEMEGKNPLGKLDKIFEDSVPEIRRRIDKLKELNVSTIPKRPDLSSHGEL